MVGSRYFSVASQSVSIHRSEPSVGAMAATVTSLPPEPPPRVSGTIASSDGIAVVQAWHQRLTMVTLASVHFQVPALPDCAKRDADHVASTTGP